MMDTLHRRLALYLVRRWRRCLARQVGSEYNQLRTEQIGRLTAIECLLQWGPLAGQLHRTL